MTGLRVLYFGRMREALATDVEEMEFGPELNRVSDLVAELRARGEPWISEFDQRQKVLVAVNQEVARMDSEIHAGDEIAFFPPVTGG